jgi:hypothetical protein
LGAALGHLAQPQAQGVELGADGRGAGQLLVGVALPLDQLAADLGGREAAIQAGGPERRVGLAVVVGDGADVIEQPGQAGLGGLAPAAGRGVQASDAGAGLALGLTDGVAAPAEQALGLALAEGKPLQGAGDEVAAPGAGERLSGFAEEGTHVGTQFHEAASWLGEGS